VTHIYVLEIQVSQNIPKLLSYLSIYFSMVAILHCSCFLWPYGNSRSMPTLEAAFWPSIWVSLLQEMSFHMDLVNGNRTRVSGTRRLRTSCFEHQRISGHLSREIVPRPCCYHIQTHSSRAVSETINSLIL
jgi:hypothetical protein